MKNKKSLASNILLSIVSFALTLVGASYSILLCLVAATFFCIGVTGIMYGFFKGQHWKCDNCDEEFELSLRESILGVNGGHNYKKLYCPSCKTRSYCVTVKKAHV